MKKVVFFLATLALAVASAAPKIYHVTLSEPASLNGTQMQPGDYKLQIEGDKVILKMGKTTVEAPAKVETSDHKYQSNQVSINKAASQPKIDEIRIGGTNTRLVFPGGSTVE